MNYQKLKYIHFDKCSRIEYKLKLYALLDLIFNKNTNEIMALEKECRLGGM